MDISYLKFNPPSFLHLSWIVNTPVLLIALVLFGVVYLIASGILMYHWKEYGMGTAGVHIARLLFLFVSVFLFAVAIIALLNF